jgi:hypothetical protein
MSRRATVWALVFAATEGFMFKLKCKFMYTLARGLQHF